MRGRLAALALVGLAAPAGAAGPAAPADDLAALAPQLRRLVEQAARQAWPAHLAPPRIEVSVGAPDARLKLPPCATAVPYLPAGVRPLGTTRVGVRCADGPRRWNVHLPVSVALWTPGFVAAAALPAGTELAEAHLRPADVDAAAADPVVLDAQGWRGRTLARPLAAGQPIRRGDLRARQWFAAGDAVAVVARGAGGAGWSVSAPAQAVEAGVEGRPASVRLASGRLIRGVATGERRVEVVF